MVSAPRPLANSNSLRSEDSSGAMVSMWYAGIFRFSARSLVLTAAMSSGERLVSRFLGICGLTFCELKPSMNASPAASVFTAASRNVTCGKTVERRPACQPRRPATEVRIRRDAAGRTDSDGGPPPFLGVCACAPPARRKRRIACTDFIIKSRFAFANGMLSSYRVGSQEEAGLGFAGWGLGEGGSLRSRRTIEL